MSCCVHIIIFLDKLRTKVRCQYGYVGGGDGGGGGGVTC